MNSAFEVGQTYSREAISEELGGNPQSALPRANGKVVCACLKPENNPDAPHTVLVTEGPGREAAGRQLAEQEGPIPVFLKESPGEWRYVGRFEPGGSTTDPGEIEHRVTETPTHERKVKRLVFLRPTEKSQLDSETSAASGSGELRQTLKAEILRRERTWKRLREAGGPEGVETDLLRRLRIYKGQAGIWTDKEKTEGILLDGGRITVSVLHTGEHYPDGLSEDELIYQYPETNRPGATDANEIEATKNAALGDVPIFVILSSGQDRALRDVRWGKVTDWNDEAGEFLIQFSPDPDSLETTSEAEKEPFRLTEDRNEKKRARRIRRGQVQFRFEVRRRYGLRCAVCGVETRELLEAAHIRDRSQEGSNDPRNGLLLCRNHHKAFDDGLFGICPDTLEIYLPGGGPSAEKLGITRSHLDPKQNEPHPEALRWAWEKWKEGLADPENAHSVE